MTASNMVIGASGKHMLVQLIGAVSFNDLTAEQMVAAVLILRYIEVERDRFDTVDLTKKTNFDLTGRFLA